MNKKLFEYELAAPVGKKTFEYELQPTAPRNVHAEYQLTEDAIVIPYESVLAVAIDSASTINFMIEIADEVRKRLEAQARKASRQ